MPLLTRPTPTTDRRGVLAAVGDRATPGQLAAGRAGAGALMVVRPRLLPRLLGVDSATATRVGWSVQMLGARELALGLGTLVAAQGPDRRGARLWVAAGVLCDAVDVLAVAGALLRGRVSKGTGTAVLGVAAAAVALGARSLREGDAEA